MKIPRRTSLQFMAVATLSVPWLVSKLSIAQTAKLKPTPQDTEGPYYPKVWSGDIDNDLTTHNGKNYTGGIPMTLAGVVRADHGEMLKNVRVDIWQIDAEGEYRHPDFGGEGPASRGFQGYGRMQTNDSGQYTFKTVKPISYGGRPPHVHFKVVADGYRSLTTEMYFAGDNKEGGLYQRFFGGFSKERDLLTVSPKTIRAGAVETLDAVFDIVLQRLA